MMLLGFSGPGQITTSVDPTTSRVMIPLAPSAGSTDGGTAILLKLQTLINMAITANLPPGMSFPLVTVDGKIGQDTVDAMIFLSNTNPQYALYNTHLDAGWIAMNAASLVQSFADHLGVDPVSLQPLSSMIAPVQAVQTQQPSAGPMVAVGPPVPGQIVQTPAAPLSTAAKTGIWAVVLGAAAIVGAVLHGRAG
jgi:hypothetical protein